MLGSRLSLVPRLARRFRDSSFLGSRGARATTLAFAGVASMLAVFAGCSADSTSEHGSDSDLIGGRVAAEGEFPATLLVKGNCTVSKVGPRHLLTAAHCVTGWTAASFAPGSPIEITSAKGTGAFADAGGEGGTAASPFRTFTIDRVEVDPAWVARCTELGNCGSVHISGRNAMADAALIIVREEITDIATAAIDLSPVEPDDPVVITGYGCEDAVGGGWNYANQRLRVAETKALPFDRVIHKGSFIYPEDRDTLAVTMGGIYVITPGPTDFPLADVDAGSTPDASAEDADASAADAGGDADVDVDGGKAEGPIADGRGGLCPGDSGGPLYRGRGDGLTVVGINANYTFSTGYTTSIDGEHSFMYGGSPVTNWHTRVDGKSGLRVGAWLRELGVKTVCTHGGC